MARGIISLIAALGFCFSAAAAPRGDRPDPSNNEFATDLYAQLASTEGNFIFSPTSIRMALAMTWRGANGQTSDEMAKVMHFDPRGNVHARLGEFAREINSEAKAGGYEIASSNALWLDSGFSFQRDYVAFIRKSYRAKLGTADFSGDPEASRRAINEWAAAQTRDRIRDLMPEGSIERNTRFVLANAIYFKGTWARSFDPKLTAEQDFRTAGGKRVKAMLMTQRGFFRYGEDDAVQVLEIPYGDDQLCMRIFLPRKANGLGALERRLTAQRLAVLAGKLREREVILYLPRFKIEAQPRMTDALQAMGLRLAFDANRADFGAMTGAGKLYLSTVVHNAFVEVNETGTEAAAATGAGGGLFGGGSEPPPQPIEFRTDRPFVFAIVHRKTDAMVFLGRVVKM